MRAAAALRRAVTKATLRGDKLKIRDSWWWWEGCGNESAVGGSARQEKEGVVLSGPPPVKAELPIIVVVRGGPELETPVYPRSALMRAL